MLTVHFRLHALPPCPWSHEIPNLSCLDCRSPLRPDSAADNWGPRRPLKIKIRQTKTCDAHWIGSGCRLFGDAWMGKGDCGAFR